MDAVSSYSTAQWSRGGLYPAHRVTPYARSLVGSGYIPEPAQFSVGFGWTSRGLLDRPLPGKCRSRVRRAGQRVPFCYGVRERSRGGDRADWRRGRDRATSPQTLSLVGLVPANATLVRLAIKLEQQRRVTSMVIGPSSSLYQNFLWRSGPVSRCCRTVGARTSWPASRWTRAFLSVSQASPP